MAPIFRPPFPPRFDADGNALPLTDEEVAQFEIAAARFLAGLPSIASQVGMLIGIILSAVGLAVWWLVS